MLGVFLFSGASLAVNTQEDLLARCAEQLSGGNALTGRFRQEKKLEFLESPVVSSGEFVIAGDGELTWHVTEPVESLMEVRGNKVTLDGERVRGRGMGGMITLLMTGFMQGDFNGITRQFQVVGEVAEGSWALTLQTRSAPLKSMIKSIELGGSQYLHFINVLEKGGNLTRIEFSEVTPVNIDE